jgi:hypothetical protein
MRAISATDGACGGGEVASEKAAAMARSSMSPQWCELMLQYPDGRDGITDGALLRTRPLACFTNAAVATEHR